MGTLSLMWSYPLTIRVLGLKLAERLLGRVIPESRSKELGDVNLSEEDERIRIILACRSRSKAQDAVSKLRRCFPHRSLLLDIEDVDLCSMEDVEEFCRRLLKRYIE